MRRLLDDGDGGGHRFGVDLVLHLAGRDLSFVAGAAVELRAFDQSVGIAITDGPGADLTTEALGMEAMVAGNHDRARHHLPTLLTALAELPPVVVLAEQQPVLLEIEI